VAGKRRELRSSGTVARRDDGGRLHLIVQQAPGGAAVGVALASPVFEDDWQNELALGAAGRAHAALAASHSRESAAALGRQVMDAASTLIDGLLGSTGARPVACGSGCALLPSGGRRVRAGGAGAGSAHKRDAVARAT